MAIAGIGPTAAAPSQPARPDVFVGQTTRPVHKNWLPGGLTRSIGLVRGRKKGKKRERESSPEDEPALAKEERQLKAPRQK